MDDLSRPDTFLHGRRQSWRQAPAPVRAWIEQQLGEPIVSWVDQTGGMSTGIASVVRGVSGALFVKGVDGVSNPKGGRMYLREAEVAARLPRRPEIPPLLASGRVEVDDGRWVLNVFPALPGRTVPHPWPPADLARVLDAWHRLTPTLLETDWDTTAQLSVFFTGWATDRDRRRRRHRRAVARAGRALGRARSADGRRGSGDSGRPTRAVPHRSAGRQHRGGRSTGERRLVRGLGAPWAGRAVGRRRAAARRRHRIGGGPVDRWPVDVLDVWRTHPACAGHDPELLITQAASSPRCLHVSSRKDSHPALPHRTIWAGAMADHLLPFVRQHTRPGVG